ncbi:hypothetical protein KPATCC21470_2875 [Kitasatospora purpeofusca]
MEWPSASSRAGPAEAARPGAPGAGYRAPRSGRSLGAPRGARVRPAAGAHGPWPTATGRSPPGCRRVPFERPGPDLVGRVKV